MTGGTPFWLAAYFKEPDIMRALASPWRQRARRTPNGKTVLMATLDGRRVTGEPASASDGREHHWALKLALDGGRLNAADTQPDRPSHGATRDQCRHSAVPAARLDVKNRRA
jgi:hypothetical protein